jgi:hypothetical protein
VERQAPPRTIDVDERRATATVAVAEEGLHKARAEPDGRVPECGDSTVILVNCEQLGIADFPSAGGAVANQPLPAGRGRPGRAAGWRLRAAGRADLLHGTGAPPTGVGLVPFAVAVRDSTERTLANVGDVWRPGFPRPDLIAAAADLLPIPMRAGGKLLLHRLDPRWLVSAAPRFILKQNETHAATPTRCRLRGDRVVRWRLP